MKNSFYFDKLDSDERFKVSKNACLAVSDFLKSLSEEEMEYVFLHNGKFFDLYYVFFAICLKYREI